MRGMLTAKQQKVLDILEKNLTLKQISVVLKMKKSALSRLIKRARDKEFTFSEAHARPPVRHYVKNGHPIRLHGQHFHIRMGEGRIVKQSFQFEDCTIRVSSKAIQIYSRRDFFGKDADTAFYVGQDFWKGFLFRLQKKLGLNILKPNVYGIIRQVRAHYAEILNEWAIEADRKKERVMITSRSGSVWLLIDNSFNLKEIETVDSKTARLDMQDVLAPRLNDWRDHPDTPLASFHWALTMEIQKTVNSLLPFKVPDLTVKPKEVDDSENKPDYVG